MVGLQRLITDDDVTPKRVPGSALENSDLLLIVAQVMLDKMKVGQPEAGRNYQRALRRSEKSKHPVQCATLIALRALPLDQSSLTPSIPRDPIDSAH